MRHVSTPVNLHLLKIRLPFWAKGKIIALFSFKHSKFTHSCSFFLRCKNSMFSSILNSNQPRDKVSSCFSLPFYVFLSKQLNKIGIALFHYILIVYSGKFIWYIKCFTILLNNHGPLPQERGGPKFQSLSYFFLPLIYWEPCQFYFVRFHTLCTLNLLFVCLSVCLYSNNRNKRENGSQGASRQRTSFQVLL